MTLEMVQPTETRNCHLTLGKLTELQLNITRHQVYIHIKGPVFIAEFQFLCS
jgi:hypothetical protein